MVLLRISQTIGMLKHSPCHAGCVDSPLPENKIQLVHAVRGMTLRVLKSDSALNMKRLLITYIPAFLKSFERCHFIIRQISRGDKLKTNVHHHTSGSRWMPPSNPKKGIKDAFDPESQSSGKTITVKQKYEYKGSRVTTQRKSKTIKDPEGDGIPAIPKLHLVNKT